MYINFLVVDYQFTIHYLTRDNLFLTNENIATM